MIFTTTPTYTEAIDFADFKGLTDVFSGMITIQGILTVLVGAAAIGLIFVGFWWGVRKAMKSIFGAFRKGRLNQ